MWKEVNVDLLHGGMLELRPPTDGKFLTFDKPNKKEKDIDGEVVSPEPEPEPFDAGEQTSLGFADESESKAKEPKPRTIAVQLEKS